MSDGLHLPPGPSAKLLSCQARCFPTTCPSGCYLSGIACLGHTSLIWHGRDPSIGWASCILDAQPIDPGTILLTKAIRILRNQLVEWLVNGYKAINKLEVVRKVCTSSFPPAHTDGSADTHLRPGSCAESARSTFHMNV